MASRILFLMALAGLTIVAGCIVHDQITTLTIGEDGSADWVRFQSNIRSSEPGEKGQDELRRFVEEFDRRADPELRRLVDAGGEMRDAHWLRGDEPYANVFVARLPSARALEKLFTFEDESGKVVARAHFSKNGSRRRFAVVIPPQKDQAGDSGKRTTLEELRRDQANGISETRFAVAGGRIVDSRGFTVADDGRSALLEPNEILALLARAEKDVEVFLEWELTEGGATAPRASRL